MRAAASGVASDWSGRETLPEFGFASFSGVCASFEDESLPLFVLFFSAARRSRLWSLTCPTFPNVHPSSRAHLDVIVVLTIYAG